MMTVKEYLSQTWRINRMVDVKLEQVQELRELAEKATSTFSDMPRSGTRNVHKTEDIIVKMMDLENEIKCDISLLLDLKADITAVIKAVSNTDYRMLLELRYLAFQSWSEVALTMRYSKDYIFELHRKALSAVKIPTESERPQ